MQSRVYRSEKAPGRIAAKPKSVAQPFSFAWVHLRYPLRWDLWGRVPDPMTRLSAHTWEIAAAVSFAAALVAVGLWLLLRKRPTPEELERARRNLLAHSGRLVDGMLLDICEVEAPAKSKNEPPRTLTMLLYSYRIGGVDYEASQDITDMSFVVDPAQVRAGFPCSARYLPGKPSNSIVVAEEWTGLRAGLPVLPAYDGPDQIDTTHLDGLRPGRG